MTALPVGGSRIGPGDGEHLIPAQDGASPCRAHAAVLSMWLVLAALWFGAESELIDMAVLVLWIATLFLLLVRSLFGRTRALLLLGVGMGLLAGAIAAWVQVDSAARSIASALAKNAPCKPEIGELVAEDPHWVDSGSMRVLAVNRFGATRRLTYQSNGLLRYGLPGDEQAAIWLLDCPAVGS